MEKKFPPSHGCPRTKMGWEVDGSMGIALFDKHTFRRFNGKYVCFDALSSRLASQGTRDVGIPGVQLGVCSTIGLFKQQLDPTLGETRKAACPCGKRKAHCQLT